MYCTDMVKIIVIEICICARIRETDYRDKIYRIEYIKIEYKIEIG